MKQNTVSNTWNATLYDEKINFVSQLGKGVVDLLSPEPGERILDLGCGTGDLTQKIAQEGATVLGIDLAESMIQAAKQKYPHLAFEVQDATRFRTAEPFDAVFSNAALHWIKQAPQVIETVRSVLRKGGRFVAELGGKGNVDIVIRGISAVLAKRGISAAERNPWYFPSIGEYSTLLEQHGFRVTHAFHFDRPTPLPDGYEGLSHWLNMFTDSFFYDIPSEQKEELFQQIAKEIEEELYRDGTWYIDYKRLRIAAVKA